MFIVPNQATTSAKTTLLVNGQYLTSLVISSFPSIRRASDVQVAFGSTVCDGVACSVIGFSNVLEGVQLSVQVSKEK
jgi:hypothetical protein